MSFLRSRVASPADLLARLALTQRNERRVARMLVDGTITITARIRSTLKLDASGQMLEKLRNGGIRGKAVIRL